MFSLKLACAFFLMMTSMALSQDLRVAVTTSFQNSGLADKLIPLVKNDKGINLQLLVVGTGQALKLGRSGDVDAILVHSKKAEEKFVNEGFGTHRREIMYNDFVLIGPKNDPADIANAKTVKEAMGKIAKSQSKFASRGDDSGTHRKELGLWQGAGLNPNDFDVEWYHSAGAGMGATLNVASGMNAYIMSDRASWLKFGNKGDLKLLFSGDPILFNQYAYLPVNPQTHSHVNNELARKFETWLTSKDIQDYIGAYTIDGETLFTPNAKADSQK